MISFDITYRKLLVCLDIDSSHFYKGSFVSNNQILNNDIVVVKSETIVNILFCEIHPFSREKKVLTLPAILSVNVVSTSLTLEPLPDAFTISRFVVIPFTNRPST